MLGKKEIVRKEKIYRGNVGLAYIYFIYFNITFTQKANMELILPLGRILRKGKKKYKN